MNILKLLKDNRFECTLVIGGLFLRLRGIGSHYVWHEIPLGYDWGLYKVWFEEMSSLSFRRWNELSGWLQSMFPPFLGMVWALLMKFGWSSEWLVTRWTVWFSWLIVVSLTGLSRRFGWVRMSAIVFFLACSSFILYELFWWNYLKQIVSLFFLLSGLHLLILASINKKNLYIALLVGTLLAVWWLSQRPWLVLCAIVWVCWFVSWIRKPATWLWSMLAVCIVGSVGWYFWDLQVLPMIQPFFDAIDIPTYNDGYKSWGTFLTMSERFRTDILMIIGGIWWFILLSMKRVVRKKYWIFLFLYLVLMLWVWGQASFYQRMIWYLSPFFILWTWYIGSCISFKKYGFYVVWILCMLQWASTLYRINASRTPLIVEQELDMIQQIPRLVERDAIIILSWIWYSPWVRGRSWREVIAPWLFDYTVWWKQSDGRSDKRINASWEQKCINVFDTFAYLGRPLYVRVWLTQDKEIMDGWCMQKILQHPKLPTSLYKLTDERK